MGHLNYDAILLWPETLGFCYLILAGITRFKYNSKSEEDFGRGHKMTLLCKWPTKYCLKQFCDWLVPSCLLSWAFILRIWPNMLFSRGSTVMIGNKSDSKLCTCVTCTCHFIVMCSQTVLKNTCVLALLDHLHNQLRLKVICPDRKSTCPGWWAFFCALAYPTRND